MHKWANNINLLILWVAITLLAGCAARQVDGQTDTDDGVAQTLLAAYRGPLNSLSGVRASQCPMFPSCSEYMRQAIAKHGVAKGWLMGTDRLMRCGHDEIRLGRKVQVNGVYKIYDPVSHNDFWWADASPTEPN